jgi:TonB-linked SusC/RagA family outer membrane protein
MKIKFYLLILVAIGFCTPLSAQIKGRVLTLPDSVPLRSANLELSNGTKFTTGADGSFQLNLVPGVYQLKISYTGFVTKFITVRFPTAGALSIYVSPVVNTLQQVTISDGYQLIPKERSTGSYTVVNSAKLNEQTGSNLLSRLEGVASGFSVDRKTNSASILVRGLSTINGPRSPLIVVDNFPYEGDLENLNPNNVESVVLLKDAAAASIWGTRAGNGVIVITTKKGRFNSPLQIQASAAYGLGEKPDPFYLKPLSPADHISVERFLFNQGYYTSSEQSTNHPPLSPVVELLILQRDGKITPEAAELELGKLGQYNLNDEFKRSVYRTSTNQQYSIRLSGGNDVINWSLSTGYDASKSSLADLNRRLSISTAQTYKLTKRLQLSTGITYVRNNSDNGIPDLTTLEAINGKLPSYTRLRDENGNPLRVAKNYRLSYLDIQIPAGFLDWNYYPATDHKYLSISTGINDFLGNINLRYTLLKGLDVTAYYQYENQLTDGKNLMGQESYATRNTINSFTQLTPTGTIRRVIQLGDIFEGRANDLNVHQGRAQANYTRTMGLHDLAFLAGAEARSRKTYNTAQRSYGYNPALLTTATVDYANTYPNFVTSSNIFIQNLDSYSRSVNNFLSLYANGTYTYSGRYTLTGSIRRDASNLFGVSTNDKWTPLWSAGLGWLISDENFFKVNWLNSLRFRASYGLSGNIDPSRSAVTTISYASNSPFTQVPFANFSSYANPDLKWETSAIVNLGLDFSMLDSRITGSLEVFRKTGTDLYGQQLIDYTAGIGTTIQKNSATTQAQGLDINLSTRNLTGKFHWETDFFLNLYRDKVLEYYISNPEASRFLRGDVSITGMKDYPVYALFSYKWAGLNATNGNPRGYLNGVISEDYNTLTGSTATIEDLVYHGPALPQFTTAIGNTLSFGALSLTFRLSGKFGYFYRRSSIDYPLLFSYGTGHEDYAKRWQQPGDELITNVPSMDYPIQSNRDSFYLGSEATIAKGDHVRLQYLNLKYNFPLKPAAGKQSSVLEVFVFSNNLGILWQADKNGIDPDYTQYAPAKTVSLGLRTNL